MKTKYLKENFEPIVLLSKNLTEILLKLNMNGKGNSRVTVRKYIKLYDINTSHFETTLDKYNRTLKLSNDDISIPLSKILVSGSTYNTTSRLKKRLYGEGYKSPICEKCGQDENWYGEHISMILDHINGINDDNRIENLRIVCPNCNATLSTYCRGKRGLIEKPKREIQMKSFLLKRKYNRPDYKTLLNEINQCGYSATGRKYNVSDNAIRKWIKFYVKYHIDN